MWSLSTDLNQRGREILEDQDKFKRELFVCQGFGGDTSRVYTASGIWTSKMSVALLFGTALGLAVLAVTRLFTPEEIKQIVGHEKTDKPDSP